MLYDEIMSMQRISCTQPIVAINGLISTQKVYSRFLMHDVFWRASGSWSSMSASFVSSLVLRGYICYIDFVYLSSSVLAVWGLMICEIKAEHLRWTSEVGPPWLRRFGSGSMWWSAQNSSCTCCFCDAGHRCSAHAAWCTWLRMPSPRCWNYICLLVFVSDMFDMLMISEIDMECCCRWSMQLVTVVSSIADQPVLLWNPITQTDLDAQDDIPQDLVSCDAEHRFVFLVLYGVVDVLDALKLLFYSMMVACSVVVCCVMLFAQEHWHDVHEVVGEEHLLVSLRMLSICLTRSCSAMPASLDIKMRRTTSNKGCCEKWCLRHCHHTKLLSGASLKNFVSDLGLAPLSHHYSPLL